ncbi:MAG: FkbM family methyltransferase [Pseudomonadota bacterium]
MLTQLRKMIYRARGYCRGQLNGESFLLDPYHSKFWHKASCGAWEPETFSVLDAHLSNDKDYVDIGAWIGPTVLYAARRARHVWCFEPDPVAYRHLVWNLELNNIGNVTAFSVALGSGFGVARMASARGERGDSTTSLLHDGAHGTDALTIGWDQFAAHVDLSNVSMVKMDTEGAEFSVIPTMLDWLKTVRPALFLSTHTPYLPAEQRRESMADLLKSLEFYRRVQHPDGQPVSADKLLSPAALAKFHSLTLSP